MQKCTSCFILYQGHAEIKYILAVFLYKKDDVESARENGKYRFNKKQNFNIKHNYHATIHDIFGIDKQVIEQAQAALQANLAKERELGIFVPK